MAIAVMPSARAAEGAVEVLKAAGIPVAVLPVRGFTTRRQVVRLLVPKGRIKEARAVLNLPQMS